MILYTVTGRNYDFESSRDGFCLFGICTSLEKAKEVKKQAEILDSSSEICINEIATDEFNPKMVFPK